MTVTICWRISCTGCLVVKFFENLRWASHEITNNRITDCASESLAGITGVWSLRNASILLFRWSNRLEVLVSSASPDSAGVSWHTEPRIFSTKFTVATHKSFPRHKQSTVEKRERKSPRTVQLTRLGFVRFMTAFKRKLWIARVICGLKVLNRGKMPRMIDTASESQAGQEGKLANICDINTRGTWVNSCLTIADRSPAQNAGLLLTWRRSAKLVKNVTTAIPTAGASPFMSSSDLA